MKVGSVVSLTLCIFSLALLGNALTMVKKEPRAPSVSGIQGTAAPVTARAPHAASDAQKPAQPAPSQHVTAPPVAEPLSTLDGRLLC